METTQYKAEIVGWDEINGTSLQGYITTTRRNLTALFGEPDEQDMDKVTCEWRLRFPSGVVATIYDWKRYSFMPMDMEYAWHIGGKSTAAVAEVQTAVGLPAVFGHGW